MNEMIFNIGNALTEIAQSRNIPCEFIVNETVDTFFPLKENEIAFAFLADDGSILNSSKFFYDLSKPELFNEHVKELEKFVDRMLASEVPAKLEIYKS